MTLKINQNPVEIKSFLDDLYKHFNQLMGQSIEDQLESDVERWLYREPHKRRKGVCRVSQAECPRCGSRTAQYFRRNGHRKRQLVTGVGVVDFWLPRVVCQCGGSVHIPFSILRPYQQIWADIELQVDRWADLGLSLRQMQTELGHQSQPKLA